MSTCSLRPCTCSLLQGFSNILMSLCPKMQTLWATKSHLNRCLLNYYYYYEVTKMLWKSEFITKTYLDPDLHKAAVWHCFLYIDFLLCKPSDSHLFNKKSTTDQNRKKNLIDSSCCKLIVKFVILTQKRPVLLCSRWFSLAVTQQTC